MSLHELHGRDPETWTPEKGWRLLREAHRRSLMPMAIAGIVGGIGGLIMCLIIFYS